MISIVTAAMGVTTNSQGGAIEFATVLPVTDGGTVTLTLAQGTCMSACNKPPVRHHSNGPLALMVCV
jgi:hypothetical protein